MKQSQVYHGLQVGPPSRPICSKSCGLTCLPVQCRSNESQERGVSRSERDESGSIPSHRASTQVEVHTQVQGDTPHLGVYIPLYLCGFPFLAQHECIEADNPTPDDTIGRGSSNQEPRAVRMIGDFDDSANALWTLYGKEARSHDEAHIRTLKDDMDGVLIFVRSYFVLRITDSMMRGDS
jgi:hypothetical protein